MRALLIELVWSIPCIALPGKSVWKYHTLSIGMDSCLFALTLPTRVNFVSVMKAGTGTPT